MQFLYDFKIALFGYSNDVAFVNELMYAIIVFVDWRLIGDYSLYCLDAE